MFDTAPRSRPVAPIKQAPVKQEPEVSFDGTFDYLGEYNPYIQSEQALYRSPQFWQHLSHQDGGYPARVKAKLEVFKMLRKLDPSAFQKLWDDPGMQESLTERLPAAVALLEYLLPVLLTAASLRWAAADAPRGGPCLLAWGACQLRAMRRGHTSCVGAYLSVYGTRADDCFGVGAFRMLAAHLLEVAHVWCTAGIGALVSGACRCWSANQQGFGELCLRVFPVREVRRPVPFSKYAPT